MPFRKEIMKKFVTLTIIFVFAMTTLAGAKPDVCVNGNTIENIAIIKDSRTLVGVRGVFEQLDFDIQWDGDSSTAVLENDEFTIVLKNGDDYFTVNGEKFVPDVPQQIINSRFYLPLRAIGEAIGADVSWDKDSETAIIVTKNSNTENTDEQTNENKVTEEETEILTDYEIITESEVDSLRVNKATPGVHTIKNFLLTALEPVGQVMYIYGGGWNEEDTGAGIEARSIGLAPQWRDFFEKQNSSYNYSNYNYKVDNSVIHLGLDCSGFVGWALYNTINEVDGLDGLVDSSRKMANNFANLGWGTLTAKGNFSDYKAGDILGGADVGHIWICIGQCDDGSVVFVHSSPPGVQISGTYTRDGRKNSQAIALASQYMQKYYPQWYSRYPDSSRDASYLRQYNRFRWEVGKKLDDPEGIQNMSVENVLKELFGE